MKKEELKQILQLVKSGELQVDEALNRIKLAPFSDIGYARIDTQRELRQGVAEVIYGAGKSAEQIEGIARAMRADGQQTILITRMSGKKAKLLAPDLPFTYYPKARIGIVGTMPEPEGDGRIVIATGGTSDCHVAEEAALTAEAFGNRVERLYDVGVAGVHRLLANAGLLMEANVVIAIAGMEGALASVVGGLVDCPVIAVPTSVGYGVSKGGKTALMSMLASCASGVAVVNIDNGYGAGYLASMINKRTQKRPAGEGDLAGSMAYQVEGFTFETEEEARLAGKEAEGIRYILERNDMKDADTVLRLYNRLVEKEIFTTPVGYRFLGEMRRSLENVSYIRKEAIRPLPVSGTPQKEPPRAPMTGSAPMTDSAPKPQPGPQQSVVRLAGTKKKSYYRPFLVSTFLAVVFGAALIGIFVITALSGNNVNILNYENSLIDQYEQWEKDLERRERELRERESVQKAGEQTEEAEHGQAENLSGG